MHGVLASKEHASPSSALGSAGAQGKTQMPQCRDVPAFPAEAVSEAVGSALEGCPATAVSKSQRAFALGTRPAMTQRSGSRGTLGRAPNLPDM